jgi:DnaJ homolog subfamily C member 28
MSNVDELIRKAIEEGKFSNLQGEGKPLQLEENPWEDPEWRMANHVLQSNGFTLPWIEQRQAIEKDLEAARLSLAQAWRERQNAEVISGKQVWQRAMQTFELQIGAINQRIKTYNLSVPLDRFQRRLVQVEQEVDRLTTPPLSDRL